MWKSITDIFKKDREFEKELTVGKIVRILHDSAEQFTEAEITEILNRTSLRVFERKKERRTELIKEARELQESMVDMKL